MRNEQAMISEKSSAEVQKSIFISKYPPGHLKVSHGLGHKGVAMGIMGLIPSVVPTPRIDSPASR